MQTNQIKKRTTQEDNMGSIEQDDNIEKNKQLTQAKE